MTLPSNPPPPRLLAVDLGLRSGLALWCRDEGLLWYRSQNFGSVSRLRRAAWGVLKDAGAPSHVVLEGDRALGNHWEKAAIRLGCTVRYVAPEIWRKVLLLDRQQRSGSLAKASADDVARRVIDWCGAARPSSLRHDAAEAILIAVWGALSVGWLPEPPDV